MHLWGFTGASYARDNWRRAGVLVAVVAATGAGILTAMGSAAQAATYPPPSVDQVVSINPSSSLSDVYQHGVTITCDPPSIQPAPPNPGYAQDVTADIPPCSITAVKLTVSEWIVHHLKLRSATIASGLSAAGPSWQTNNDGTRTEDVYVVTLPHSLVRELRSKVIDGFDLDGLYNVVLLGKVSYPYNDSGNNATTTTVTQDFEDSLQWGPGYVNSCTLPVNQAPQITLADPHGKLCPGYR